MPKVAYIQSREMYLSVTCAGLEKIAVLVYVSD